MSAVARVTYTCDWTDEYGDVCGSSAAFEGTSSAFAADAAREAGWGRYTNAHVRRERWTTGANLWFCPVHATVFRNNHGWGGLEDYTPPRRWWISSSLRRGDQ